MSIKDNKGKERSETPILDTLILDLVLREIKLKLLDKYNGDRSKLDTFLAQCELFFAFNVNKFKNET